MGAQRSNGGSFELGEELSDARRRIVELESELAASSGADQGLFGRAFDGHRAAMLITDRASGRIVAANRAASRYYGCPVEQLRQLSFHDVNCLPEAVGKEHMERAAGREDGCFAFPLRRAGGQVCKVEIQASPMCFGGEEFHVSIIRDVTESQNVADELARSTKLVNVIEMVDSIGGWEIDLARGAVHWTDGLHNTLGVARDDPLPPIHRHLEWWVPEHRPRVIEGLWGLIDRDVPLDVTAELVKKGDERRWFRMRGQADRVGNRCVRLFGTLQDVHERVCADKARARSENLLEKVFEVLPTGLWISDERGNLLSGNPAGVKIWGGSPLVSPGEYGVFKARRLPSREEIAPDDWALAHTINEGITIRDELIEIDGFDGETRVVSNSTAPVLDDDGNIMAAIVVNHDLTQLKVMEGSLRESEARVRSYFTNAPFGMFIFDERGAFLDVNPAACAMTGYSEQELISMTIRDVVPSENRRGHIRRLGVLLESGRLSTEVESLSKRGERRRWQLDAVALGDGLYLAFADDITTRTENLRARRESDERFRAVFESVADFLTLVDVGLRVVVVNRFATGVQAEDVLGKPLYELVDDGDQARVRGILETVLNDGVKQSYDTTLVTPGQPTAYFSSVAAPIEIAGEIVGVVVSSRDVTKRVVLERDNDSLAQQMRRSQRMESLGHLAGGIAHDFNNLLTAIENSAGFVEEAMAVADPAVEDVRQIRSAVKRAAMLTRQLLAFGRRQIMRTAMLDVNTVCLGMERMLSRVLGEDVTVLLELAEDLAPVEADLGQLEQVIMNLAVNAREAMPEGGTLTLKTANLTLDTRGAALFAEIGPGDYVAIVVTDTGRGMTDEVRERLFEPFFTTQEGRDNAGLGLATVYGVVRQSGGDIRVESELGSGASFHVVLPRAEGEIVRRRYGPALRRGGGDETILLVEDERIVSAPVARILSSAGYRVITASDGEEALRVSAELGRPLDLLLTDVVMPGMGGGELAGRIKQDQSHVRVLYISGYADDEALRHGRVETGADLLPKPFSAQELLSRVRGALDRE